LKAIDIGYVKLIVIVGIFMLVYCFPGNANSFFDLIFDSCCQKSFFKK